MSATDCEPASLQQIRQVVVGQATALGRHEQALSALFTKVQEILFILGQIQTLLTAPGGRDLQQSLEGKFPGYLYGVCNAHGPWDMFASPAALRVATQRMQVIYFAVLPCFRDSAFPVLIRKVQG